MADLKSLYGAVSEQTPPQSLQRRPNTCIRIFVGLGVVVVCVAVGFLAGWYSWQNSIRGQQPANTSAETTNTANIKSNSIVRQDLFNNIKADKIRENLREYSSFPHLAGTPEEQKLADILYRTWQNQSMDYVTTDTYDVLLSFPNKSDDSVIRLLDSSGAVLFESQREEKNLTADQNHPDIAPPYIAFSATRDAKGPLVYVNYGQYEDFEYLATQNIDLNGAICIARYGKNFRGLKASEAENRGCIGLILYTDPKDYHMEDVPGYPDSWWMPPTGAQRGNVLMLGGDPLTPAYPSIASAYRQPVDEVDGLPDIPVHPISYGDAQAFLRNLAGPMAPEEWQGALNFEYRIGPGFQNNDMSVEMHITTFNKRTTTTNVIGYIEGGVEPDRYIVVGNHYDAWVFGAVDPNSGTAVMMELSRVLIEATKNGWRPDRTIIFCAWGSEEQGLVGSFEWVENYIQNLGQRAVAYLNVDFVAKGNFSLAVSAVPLLYDLAHEAAKQVQTPNKPGQSLYDEWYSATPDVTTMKPRISALGFNSDHTPFVSFAGIPAMDMHWTFDRNKWSLSDYPVYHTAYDTFDMFQNYIDPEFKYSKALCEYWAEMVLRLCDATILPFNVRDYAIVLDASVRELQETYNELLEDNGLSFAGLKSSVSKFSQEASSFQERLANIDKSNILEVRSYNDQLLNLERAFIDPSGLPAVDLDRPIFRHVMFSLSTYSGSNFPGLADVLLEIKRSEEDGSAERWEAFRRHLATVEFIIDSAASTLKPFTQFN